MTVLLYPPPPHSIRRGIELLNIQQFEKKGIHVCAYWYL